MNYLLISTLSTMLLCCSLSEVKAQENSGQLSDSTKTSAKLLTTEQLAGQGVWIDPRLQDTETLPKQIRVTIWFKDQFLRDGRAYNRRAKEFAAAKRTELRSQVMATLKNISRRSWKVAQPQISELAKAGLVKDVQQHWIVNGFSCTTAAGSIKKLSEVPGVRKLFFAGGERRPSIKTTPVKTEPPTKAEPFKPDEYLHPWYIHQLLADRVWRDFKITGQGSLNVVSDGNFVFSNNVLRSIYHNSGEVPNNSKDDDGSGLVDDIHGFDFDRDSNRLTLVNSPANTFNPRLMHGFMCAAIICGQDAGENANHEFGIAPGAKWAGVIASSRLESAIEWSVEQQAATYSMSFSIPGLQDYRSHWRKAMEHGSFCGICFVSGAGNFARTTQIPVQMRTPEDIPSAVFAAAGVQRDLARTPFSSQGPVEWKTEHYQDGRVLKPEVCAFNHNLPLLFRNGKVMSTGISGNSVAGPMFAGCIALMLSADPDLLPWDLRDIITATATDVGPQGIDVETGHGLINCYRAVKEVLRRKALRDGEDTAMFTGRSKGDELDVSALQKQLRGKSSVVVDRVQLGGQAQKLGLQPGDVLLAYDQRKVLRRADLIEARTVAIKAKKKSVDVSIRRGDKTIKFKFKVGQMGLIPGERAGIPAFR